MKRKIIWSGGVVLFVLVIIVLGLTLFIKSFLTTDRLVGIIVPKIETFTGRKASIGKINATLFKGISVQDFSLKEKDGTADFMRMKEFDLNYRLWPLLRKKLVITKMEIVSPGITIVKRKDGSYNFSDILEKADEASKKGTAQKEGEEKGLPYSIETDHIEIRDANVVFSDEQGGTSASLQSDMDLKLAPGSTGTAPEITGKADLKKISVKAGGGEIKGNGDVKIEKKEVQFILSALVGKDTVKVSGHVKEYRTKPSVSMDITANELDLDRLLALSGTSKAPVSSGEKGQARERASGGKGGDITAAGVIKVSSAKYQDYKLSNFSASYRYKTAEMSISPLDFEISGGSQVQLAGKVKGDLRLFPISGPDVKNNLSGKISADLNRCEFRKTRVSQAVASFTQIPELANPRFDSAKFLFNIGKGKIGVDGNMTSNIVTINPTGFITLEKRLDLAGDLKVSPAITGKIAPSSFTSYLKDEKGWTVIPLKITGTTENPRVGLNQAAVGAQIQKKAGQEIEKRIFKFMGK